MQRKMLCPADNGARKNRLELRSGLKPLHQTGLKSCQRKR